MPRTAYIQGILDRAAERKAMGLDVRRDTLENIELGWAVEHSLMAENDGPPSRRRAAVQRRCAPTGRKAPR